LFPSATLKVGYLYYTAMVENYLVSIQNMISASFSAMGKIDHDNSVIKLLKLLQVIDED
jgi:hypothetical protein